MTRKSFLAAYFATLVLSVGALLFLSWLLIQSLNKDTQLESQHKTLQVQLKVAQEAVKRFEKHQADEESKQREYDELQDKYLKTLTKNQGLVSDNVSELSHVKELLKSIQELQEANVVKLKEQRRWLIREHARRIREKKREFEKDKDQMSAQFETEKAEMKRASEAEIAKYKRRVADLEKEKSNAEEAHAGQAALQAKLDRAAGENLKLKQENESLLKKISQISRGASAAVERPLATKVAPKDIHPSTPLSSQLEVDRLKHENAVAHYNLGVIHMRAGEYQDALREFLYSLNLNPADPLTHYNLGYLYDMYLKDFDKAIYYYQNYMRLDPAAKDIREVEEQLLRLKIRREIGVEGALKVSKY